MVYKQASLEKCSPTHAAAEVKDKINYGGEQFFIIPALIIAIAMDEIILDKIAFGGVKELEKIYQ